MFQEETLVSLKYMYIRSLSLSLSLSFPRILALRVIVKLSPNFFEKIFINHRIKLAHQRGLKKHLAQNNLEKFLKMTYFSNIR